MNAPSLASALLTATAATLSAAAQTPLHAHFGDIPGDYFGHRASDLGDVDGDGFTDYAIAAPWERSQGTGYVRVFSGGTGEALATLSGISIPDGWGSYDHFGWAASGVGDVNGDQVPDLLVGAPHDHTFGVGKGLTWLISGSDWSTIRTRTGGHYVYGTTTAPLGDVNGDGVPDYLVGEASFVVNCVSGATGATIWQFDSSNTQDNAIVLSPVTGDATGDGIPDAIVGAMGFGWGNGGGYVTILDGVTGTQVQLFTGDSLLSYGKEVSFVGDLNGDARDEIAVHNGSGMLWVYDAASGAVIHSYSTGFRRGLCGVGDQDGDGVPDFASSQAGYAKVYSGASGAVIRTYDLTAIALPNGTKWLTPVADLDGDGKQELLIGAGGPINDDAGAVFLSDSYALQDLGHALGGAVYGDPMLSGEGTLEPGSLLRLYLWNTWATAPASLIIGFSELHFPVLGGTLVPSPDIVVSGLAVTHAGGLDLAFPVGGGLPPGDLVFQYWILDPSGPQGVTASNAVKGTLP